MTSQTLSERLELIPFFHVLPCRPYNQGDWCGLIEASFLRRFRLHFLVSPFPRRSAKAIIQQKISSSQFSRRKKLGTVLMDKLGIRSEKSMKSKKKPIRVVHISDPMKVRTSASEFRSLVQSLTGKNSDVRENTGATKIEYSEDLFTGNDAIMGNTESEVLLTAGTLESEFQCVENIDHFNALLQSYFGIHTMLIP